MKNIEYIFKKIYKYCDEILKLKICIIKFKTKNRFQSKKQKNTKFSNK